jgi:hypothetical protein
MANPSALTPFVLKLRETLKEANVVAKVLNAYNEVDREECL